MKYSLALSAAMVCSLLLSPCVADDFEAFVEEIRREVVKDNTDAGGWPLPVASHWAHGYGYDNFGSDYQTELLERGHRVMPNLSMPRPGQGRYGDDERAELVRSVVERLAKWRAPFSMRGANWEAVMLSKEHPADDPGRWRNLPAEKSPRVINLEGELDRRISPFGAVEPWYEAGKYLAESPAMRQFQEWYPDPPRVVLLSNNESPLLEPKHGVEKSSKRYVDQYGTGKSAYFQRGVMADGYLERYNALFRGVRDGLVSPGWKKHGLIAGYNAFGPPHFARWEGWGAYSYTSEERIDPWHLAWEGGSPSYYTHNWNASTDYRVHSPQVEANNWVFMLEEAYAARPNFWFELSVWDGNFSKKSEKEFARSKMLAYEKAGQSFTPARYGGFVQYGMWLTRPRVVREFRGWMVPRSQYAEYYDALLEAVDRVWANETLTRFWRDSELVPNRSRKHPYQTAVPEKWREVDRWFLLNTSLDAVGEWTVETEIPVFSLARVTGEEGSREWLLYAHSPLGPRAGVSIEVPGFGAAEVDVTPAGSFYLLRERDGSVAAVGG